MLLILITIFVLLLITIFVLILVTIFILILVTIFVFDIDNNIFRADPKIQDVRGYWGEREDKGISEQTVIQTRKIFSENILINIFFCKYIFQLSFQ